jgi:hypothetical protein
VKRIVPLLGGAYLVFLGWYGARHLGENWRVDLLAALIGLYAVVSVVLPLYEQHVRRQLDAEHPATIAELRRADPELDAFIEDRTRVNERTDWVWRATDLAAGVGLTFYPPLIYTLWRYRELQSETPFDGVAVVLMLSGVVAYLVWRGRRLHQYRCPSCDGRPVRLRGEQIRYACAPCGLTWRLGQPVLGDGAAATPPA